MSVDFQIFLLAPMILILYVKNRRVGLAVFIAIFFGSVFTAYGMAWANNYHVNMPSVKNSTPEPDY